jgi:5-methyltetrahydropteroyltriglutamate--homocysteine methyltransferase
MEPSARDRFFETTHTGSLPAGEDHAALTGLLRARALHYPFDHAEFDDAAAAAVRAAVGLQSELGIRYVSSGEADRAGFTDSARLTGFDGPPHFNWRPADLIESGLTGTVPLVDTAELQLSSTGPVRHNPEVIESELRRFLAALAAHGIGRSRGFVPEPSPGIMLMLGTSHYASEAAFLNDLARALREEYTAIAEAGLTVQVDACDIALCWQTIFHDADMAQYLDRVKIRVDAINRATQGIPRSQLRVHVCYGNWPGPHDHDITLDHIIGELTRLQAGMLVLELASPRHRWELEVLRDHPLPAGMKLAAGVVDSSTIMVEHERTVMRSLLDVAAMTGLRPDMILATPDCGFRSLLGMAQPLYTTRRKLEAMVAGARLAAEQAGQVLAAAG